MAYKRLASILVAIHVQDTRRVLVLQQHDDPGFWQSVAGSVGEGETAPQATMREVKGEVTVDVVAERLTSIDYQRTVEFGIFSHLRHCYAPGATRNMEPWFCLALPHERQIVFTEHLARRWLDAFAAAALTKS